MNVNDVKVHNLNIYEFKQMFKGQEILIPANEHVVMDYDEAIDFLGMFSPIKKLSSGLQDPKSYKKLKINEEDEQRVLAAKHKTNLDEVEKKYVCHMCTKEFRTKQGLLKHIKASHVDSMVDKDAKDELLDDEDL